MAEKYFNNKNNKKNLSKIFLPPNILIAPFLGGGRGDERAMMYERAACLLLILAPASALALHTSVRAPVPAATRRASLRLSAAETAEYDVVVIGSGIGGLSAAAAAASTGLSVAVLESHDTPGGAAHEWNIKGYHFESGPSLYAGLSPSASPNPLKHVFQIIGEEPEWITYDRWGTYLPDGDFAAAVGAEDFLTKLDTYGGPDARVQVANLSYERVRLLSRPLTVLTVCVTRS